MLCVNSDWPDLGPDEPARPPGIVLSGVSILIVDNDPQVKTDFARILAARQAVVETATSIAAAEALQRRRHFDLIIVSMHLPGASATGWLRALRAAGACADVIFVTDYAELDAAVSVLRAGAADLLIKPLRPEQMLASVQRCLTWRHMMRRPSQSRRCSGGQRRYGIVGESAAVCDIYNIARRAAPTLSTILIEGETGTGKELIARAIHSLSGRTGEFVAVNCGAIAAELLESELFGHTKGAFTGAHSARQGLFNRARGGTILLDEIGEMPLALQANLLRILEDKRVRPVGSDRELTIDCRVLAATNVALAQRVEQGGFREDLFYRLNVLRITVPPLRDRLEDIPPLVEYFTEKLSSELGVSPIRFAHRDIIRLQGYHWPGNIRELKNVIERSLLLGELPDDCGERACALPSQAPATTNEMPLAWTLSEVMKHHTLRVLRSVAGNKSAAARRLGVSRKTLDRKLNAWGHPEIQNGEST